jgi:hypothetical protein
VTHAPPWKCPSLLLLQAAAVAMLPVQTSPKKFFVPTKVIVQAVMIKSAMPPAQSIAVSCSGEVQPLLSGCGASRPWILRLTLP